jgi:hypothetical protein
MLDRRGRMTNRAGVADAAQKLKDTLLRPDDGRPEDMYSKIVEIDLTTLEPHLSMRCCIGCGQPYTPPCILDNPGRHNPAMALEFYFTKRYAMLSRHLNRDVYHIPYVLLAKESVLAHRRAVHA